MVSSYFYKNSFGKKRVVIALVNFALREYKLHIDFEGNQGDSKVPFSKNPSSHPNHRGGKRIRELCGAPRADDPRFGSQREKIGPRDWSRKRPSGIYDTKPAFFFAKIRRSLNRKLDRFYTFFRLFRESVRDRAVGWENVSSRRRNKEETFGVWVLVAPEQPREKEWEKRGVEIRH